MDYEEDYISSESHNIGQETTGIPGFIRIFSNYPNEPHVEYRAKLHDFNFIDLIKQGIDLDTLNIQEIPEDFSVSIETGQFLSGSKLDMLDDVKLFVDLNKEKLLWFWNTNPEQIDDVFEFIDQFQKVSCI